MKEILTNIFVFMVLAVSFSGLSGCSGTSNSNNASNTNAAGNSAGKTSGYPKLASALADAELELVEGGKFKISDKKGKVLMLNIWGTWCGPCRQEMPHLIEMQNTYRDNGFEVLGLNIGSNNGQPESIEDIQRFAADMNLNYTLARSPGRATAAFYAISKQQVVPQSMLIDREGHIRGIFVGGGQRIFDSMKTNLAKVMAEQP